MRRDAGVEFFDPFDASAPSRPIVRRSDSRRGEVRRRSAVWCALAAVGWSLKRRSPNAQLDAPAANLAGLEVAAATAILDAVDASGDFNNDGVADGADFLLWQQQLGQTAVGLAALARTRRP